MITESIFKSYDIRGVYPDELNQEAARLIAQAYLQIVSRKLNKKVEELKLVIGRDIRKSSEPLFKSVVEVLLKSGVEVDDIGLVSANDYYFAVGFYGYDGGLMLTASHNPPEYGGIKMILGAGGPKRPISFLSGHEIHEEIKQRGLNIEPVQAEGKLSEKDVSQDHINHILSFINPSQIKPFKIVVDAGNGMAGLLTHKLLGRLPVKMVGLFTEPDGNFSNRPPNPLTPGASDKLAKKVLEEKADFGAMFDVDGDRIFLVDERGSLIRGDMVLLLLAKAFLAEHPGCSIVYNLICSQAVPELIAQWGGKAVRSEVGYINLARHMREENGLMSGEVSGHFAFKDNYYADSAFIALVLAIKTISADGRPLSKIIKDYSLYARGDEMNFEVGDIKAELAKIRRAYKDNLRDEIDGLTFEFGDWWFNVRPSNTEPLLRVTVEAKAEKQLKQKQAEIKKLIEA